VGEPQAFRNGLEIAEFAFSCSEKGKFHHLKMVKALVSLALISKLGKFCQQKL
jgi:hypothetical protein